MRAAQTICCASTPAEVVLRMLVLKHLSRWSYAEMEQEVRANLVYRAFARISCDAVPDAKTILKIAQALGPAVIQSIRTPLAALMMTTGIVMGTPPATVGLMNPATLL